MNEPVLNRAMRTIVIIALFMALPLFSAGQEYQVMFYNAENLFDIHDDTTKNDDEFLPEGVRRWTAPRYHRKLNSLARAVAAGGWELPSLVGLCEVENEAVVRDLARHTTLAAGNYSIVHRESPDQRGIDLALLYRRDHFSVAGIRAWLPESDDFTTVNTRNLLYVKLTAGADTLHLMLAHFPSRRGGIMAAAGLREQMFRLAAAKTDSLQRVTPDAAIMIMGDLNSTPDDPLMQLFTAERGFMNLAAPLAMKGKGSYWYRGSWEMFDQIVVSHALADTASALHVAPGSFRVVDEPFLLTDADPYPGKKPFATWSGFRWTGGYSDHLPVMVRLAGRQE